MPVGDADRIRRYLCRRIEGARQAGEKQVTLRAGDVHRALGMSNVYANVCQVLEGKKFAQWRVCRPHVTWIGPLQDGVRISQSNSTSFPEARSMPPAPRLYLTALRERSTVSPGSIPGSGSTLTTTPIPCFRPSSGCWATNSSQHQTNRREPAMAVRLRQS